MENTQHAAGTREQYRLMVSSTLKSRVHSAANRQRAQQLAWRWIRDRWPRLAHGVADPAGGRMERFHAGARLTVLSEDRAASWIAEITDIARDSRPWRTRVAIMDGPDVDILMIQAACVQTLATPAKVAPPRLLAAWAEGLEIHDAAEPAFGVPWSVDDEAGIERLLGHLLAEHRSLPVITLASKGTSRYFGVDPAALATAMQGMAHVVCVTQEARLGVSRRLGARLAPVQGAARIYAPGLREGDSAEHHPLVRPPGADQVAQDRATPSFRLAIIGSACAASVRAAGENRAVHDRGGRLTPSLPARLPA